MCNNTLAPRMRNVIDNVRVSNVFLQWTNILFDCEKNPF